MIPLSLILKFIWVILFCILLIGAVLYECVEKFSKKPLDPKRMKCFAIIYVALFVICILSLIVSDYI